MLPGLGVGRKEVSMARSSKGSGSKKSSGGGGKYRSAISGRYVTAKHGKRSPNTTVKESK